MVYNKRGSITSLNTSVIRAELKSALGDLLSESNKLRLSPRKKSYEILIPLAIFSSKRLGVLEALVKYLKEKEELSFREIRDFIKRDNKSLWSTYQKAIKKERAPFSAYLDTFRTQSHCVPLTDFVVENLSCFESITLNLKNNYGLNYAEIAEIFGRDYHTIWTTYKRAEKKTR